jgi:DNA-binding MarR family transcriptional regulator
MNNKNTGARRPTSVDSSVRVAYLIGRVDRALRRAISDAVAPMNLTLQQYTALSVMSVHERLSNAELAERSFMTPQSANEMVKAMEAKKLIARRPDPNHGRIIQLRLTTSGRRALREADAAVLAIERQMLDKMPRGVHGKFREQLKICLGVLLDFRVGS